MIGNPQKTNEILQKYDIRARKRYGQNFLVDENILNKIIKTAGVAKTDGIIEIGPGIGALTERLIMASKKVLAYEIDERFIAVLENELGNLEGLKIRNSDFLEADLEADRKYFSDCARVLVVSNIPYYITTPIISKLLKQGTGIDEFYLMVQKEVGLRLTSKPNTKDYNAFSVFISHLAEVSICFPISQNCFIPRPDVDSLMIKLKRIEPKERIENLEHFQSFVQNIFENRRKTLFNNLLRSYQFTKEGIAAALNSSAISEQARSESLDLGRIIGLYKNLFDKQ
ncbi:MAG: 16S rRNA (adenine(1518)-N(6)/adenine(1519)-N(6))-dimethyltransferase RsmA [Caldisericia bacterium]|nr:16S rRNA (adenine(1518)-N(6)/adenine(1519)-N(6))-dimethyltransferase RsmA [Caldisericia bacterium]